MKVHGNIIDLSSNNHPHEAPIGWGHVKKAGIVGVVVKASQMYPDGSAYTNPWFHRDLSGALAVGLPVIAYHFASVADPRVMAGKMPPYDVTKEAEFFIKTASVHFARVVDIETSGDTNWTNAFLGQLEGDNFNKCAYGSEFHLNPAQVKIYGRLWIAAYPGPVTFGAMHQFTDKGQVPGIEGYVDLSVWRKTRSEFITLFSGKPPNQVRNLIKKILKK